MADRTKIEWADATLNYANGCSLASPGCTNCYAMKQAHRFEVRRGLTVQSKGGMVWTGEVRMNDKALAQALAWKRGRRIFWNAHGDLFHENVTDEQIDRLFAVCALTPQHTHMILTKRSARMRDYMTSEGLDPLFDGRLARIRDAAYRLAATAGGGWNESAGIAARQACVDALHRTGERTNAGFRNVWLGVSVEDQQRADERIPDLLATPAAVRFISAEPLLGPVDLTALTLTTCTDKFDALQGMTWAIQSQRYGGGRLYNGASERAKVDWVIMGGESGPKARPMHPAWARSLRDQCQDARVPMLFKQWGEWAPLGWEHAGSQLHITLAGKIVPKCEADAYRDVPGQGLIEIARVGKKAAGRLLDERTHDEFPA